jgi:heme/copper-type cytochrome/quinol oxidase subunit 2
MFSNFSVHLNLHSLTHFFFGSHSSVLDLHRFGFAAPANQQMQAIVDMFYATSLTMLYILLFIILFMWAMLYTRNEDLRYPVSFKKWQETLIDIGVIFVPLIIVYFLTVPAVGYVLHLDRYVQEITSVFNVDVIGHQWYWSYYLDCLQNPMILDLFFIYHVNFDAIEFVLYDFDSLYQFDFDQIMDLDASISKKYLLTTKFLVLPVLHHIKVLVTSEDVIHSWALPQLGIKIDAIPGRVQMVLLQSNSIGTFYGQCSELCGVNHAFMPINVEFVTDVQFFDWYFKNLDVRPYRLLLAHL